MKKKKQKLDLCLILLSAFLISNCRAVVNPIPSPIALVTQLTENSTPVETKTPIITPTATLSPSGIEYHCINVNNDMTKLSDIGGTLVLNGFLDPGAKNDPSLFLNLSSRAQFSFTIDYATDRLVVSPSGDYLAYDVALEPDYRNTQINFLNSKGEMLTKAVERDVAFIEWLNDKTLLLNSFNENYEHHLLVFLSPFDNTQKIVQPFATQKERIALFDSDLLRQWGFYSYHKIIYNPTFTRAIYAALDHNGAKVIFRDLTSNQDISTLLTQAWGVSPKWSPDGTKLAIGLDFFLDGKIRKYELVILDQDGKQLFTTHLSTPPGSVYIASLSWSPNGNFLLIETSNAKDNPNVVVVDLVQERANIIKTGYEPIGWMK